MREIQLNGYIDDEVWFGDEISPDALHDLLYADGKDPSEDVHIRLNSYGGSCNAAVRMHDDLAAYPGRVTVTVSTGAGVGLLSGAGFFPPRPSRSPRIARASSRHTAPARI